ncbi:Cro/Cl family transcriptional regulator, partial [Cronobacter sakazakii]|nr:Cro/Cl family transcriptional regulator [Cronobacter sakazakii]
MYTKSVISHFGSKAAIARALGISQVAVTRWGETVPEKRAARLDHITNGVLKYDPDFY